MCPKYMWLDMPNAFCCRLSLFRVFAKIKKTVSTSPGLPYFVCINNLKVKKTVPRYIYIKQNSDISIHTFKAEVKKKSIYDHLNCRTDANPCSNYDILDKIIAEAAGRYMPSKRVKYNKHKHNKS